MHRQADTQSRDRKQQTTRLEAFTMYTTFLLSQGNTHIIIVKEEFSHRILTLSQHFLLLFPRITFFISFSPRKYIIHSPCASRFTLTLIHIARSLSSTHYCVRTEKNTIAKSSKPRAVYSIAIFFMLP